MKVTDRRYIKTEAVIRKCLISLLNEKDFSAVQIRDLIQLADINRSTFYLHYRSLDDILGALEDEFVTGFSSIPSFHGSFSFTTDFFNSLVEWAYANRKLTKSVLTPFTSRFKEKLDNAVLASFSVSLPLGGKHFCDDKSIRLVSLTDGIFLILRSWSNDNFHYEKSKIVSLLKSFSEADVYKDFINR